MDLFQLINGHFDTYAAAITNYDTKGMGHHFAVPCTFLSAEKTTTFSEASKLEGLFNQGIGFYKQFGITKAVADVRHKRLVAANIAHVKLRWLYYNTHNTLLYHCDYEYILKANKHNRWEIEMAISINEKEQMEAWLKSMKKANP
ncbi:hypothetical protein CAP35_10180 [Chitinophagaceae bacterium IBVUCB1]|nr:hypothetical protein CAP35_10180 [Chitinophagaceae bacterium IBVUCB1]